MISVITKIIISKDIFVYNASWLIYIIPVPMMIFIMFYKFFFPFFIKFYY